ncbi:MAG: type II toxin-antitoxin system RelE/ParE family toxin [Bacteroidaceae bacterium]|nr:type II toxin-antitoxin system RelE/ParE family toxin [Bacteroidaceae bacterium]
MKYVLSTMARKQFEGRALWYHRFKGTDFERSFVKNIFETLDAISQMPTIGRIEGITKTSTRRSFLAHPGCRIFYRHDSKMVRVERLHFSPMRPVSASGLSIN